VTVQACILADSVPKNQAKTPAWANIFRRFGPFLSCLCGSELGCLEFLGLPLFLSCLRGSELAGSSPEVISELPVRQ
jgi:hypothetical protein